MQPSLSYILIEALAKRCLMQVPSMRVENCEPISWASCGGDLAAEEGGDLLGLDAQHRLAGELLVERRQRRRRAEHQIGRVFHLHQAPMVGLAEGVEHRAALPGIAVEHAVQAVGRELVGQSLGARHASIAEMTWTRRG
jgi:hypothetical protein